MTGWIAKELYSGDLAETPLRYAFEMAIEEHTKRGFTRKVEQAGIKHLTEAIKGYHYECKVLGSEFGKWRLLGNEEKVRIPKAGGGFKTITIIVFRLLDQKDRMR